MASDPNSIKTLVIDNFQGRLTKYNTGDINSGYSKYATTFGNDPFSNPTNLTWFEVPSKISGYEDEATAAKIRLENGITYAYVIAQNGHITKIQVNDPTTYNPNFDNPVLLTDLSINNPTFAYGPSLQFYGSTEKIYAGGDVGVSSVNFDGTGEAFVGIVGSWVQNVPRPSAEFIGKTYWGNGSNIAEIDVTGTVTSYAKLSPGFPAGTQVRDIDVSSDGNYLVITVSDAEASSLVAPSQDTNLVTSADSYTFYWNGTDDTYTSFTKYPARSLSSNLAFGDNGYTIGYDINGAALFQNGVKLFNFPGLYSPNFSATLSLGNMIAFMAPESSSAGADASLFVYGSFDEENPPGLYRYLKLSGTGTSDISDVPFAISVSNQYYGLSRSGYANNLVGSAKIYFSTMEIGSGDIPVLNAYTYKFSPSPTGLNSAIQGVYETQSQLFSKKVKVGEVRIYFDPLVTNNSFQIDLIGSGDQVISGSSETFTVGTNAVIGQDYAWYNPAIAPTYAIGVRITNLGTANMTFAKVEVDYTLGGR